MEKEKRQDDAFERARKEIEGSDSGHAGKSDKRMAPAGPHVNPGTTNTEATPDAGALPSAKPTDDIEPGTG